MLRPNPIARWFRPKIVGVGIAPATWEGWACTLILAVLVVPALARSIGRLSQ